MATCGFSTIFTATLWETLTGNYSITGGEEAWRDSLSGYRQAENKMIVLKG